MNDNRKNEQKATNNKDSSSLSPGLKSDRPSKRQRSTSNFSKAKGQKSKAPKLNCIIFLINQTLKTSLTDRPSAKTTIFNLVWCKKVNRNNKFIQILY